MSSGCGSSVKHTNPSASSCGSASRKELLLTLAS
eukprot:CAMPEP_0179194102 /NCGR_PEP_ID=MMETSP0796-20121207/96469_1 /TAXON_ID=73915 /ORGANISM="Pyrodinium bahamense, Strain pbaha01" /LENGTH=33 /DNA_ID= /DNA_START= /DNA_END= /DNA_ORIENTATION=